MKTILQELIEELEALTTDENLSVIYRAGITTAMVRAKHYLEKEKIQIMDDYEAGRADCITAEQYYKEAYG